MSIIDPSVEAVIAKADALQPNQLRLLQKRLLGKQFSVEEEGITEADFADNSPAAKTVDKLLKAAVAAKATSLHLEPRNDTVGVRLRVDGLMRSIDSLPGAQLAALAARVKQLAALNSDETRSPQYGTARVTIQDNAVDLRISVMPTASGEKVVIGLQTAAASVPDFEALGLWGANAEALAAAITAPHGLIVAAGPADSGTTTTLYSALSALNQPRTAIATIEDPIAQQLEGINQTQVNTRAGLTFASGLQALLRQDPSIIMVGELRGRKVAELAVQTALGGRLVLSALPASTAVNVISMLGHLGIEPFLTASTVRAVVAQRLVRQLCQNCKQAFTPQEHEMLDTVLPGVNWAALQKLAGMTGPAILWKAAPAGCKDCDKTGYRGRIGLFEVMPMTPTLQKLIVGQADSTVLSDEALKNGMIPLLHDGLVKVLRGQTSIDEVVRVTSDIE